MYKIGYAWKPGELDKNADYWTLDIDYVNDDNDSLQDHGAIIQVNGSSLSICMVKAKFICEMLNEKVFHSCEVFVDLLEMAKALEVSKMEFKVLDEDDA